MTTTSIKYPSLQPHIPRLRATLSLSEDRVDWRRILLRMAVPAVTLGLAWAGNAVEIEIAEANARRIIGACERFQAAKSRFPKELDELVPRHIPSVPRAKYLKAGS